MCSLRASEEMKCLFSFFKEVMREKECRPRKKRRYEYTSEKSRGGRHKKEHARKTSRKPNRVATYILERADIEFRVITNNNNHPKKIHPPKRLLDLCKVTITIL